MENHIKINKKVEEAKNIKRKRLLDAGFNLFLENGLEETSIQDIANKANVGKGTFYLYFKDKSDLHDNLIITKSEQLFDEALNELNKKKIKKFDKQIIYIIDYVINELEKKPLLLKLISKNLSIGVYNKKINKVIDKNYIGLKEKFINGVKENNIYLKNPEITLYMILELASSTCFSCILKNEPTSIEEFKPYLYNAISNMILSEKK